MQDRDKDRRNRQGNSKGVAGYAGFGAGADSTQEPSAESANKPLNGIKDQVEAQDEVGNIVSATVVGTIEGATIGGSMGGSAFNRAYGSMGLRNAARTAFAARSTTSLLGTGVGVSRGATGLLGRALGPAVTVGFSAWDFYSSFSKDQYVDAVGAIGGGAGAIGGAALGAKGGAAVGAGIGAFFGGIGAAPGALIGGIIGGIGGGIAGWFGGKEVAKAGARAVGVKNKYIGTRDIEDFKKEYSNHLQEMAKKAGQEISEEDLQKKVDADIEKLIPLWQDKGVGFTRDGDIIASSYADFNEEVSLDTLHTNFATLAMKKGKITEERFEEYKKRFETQIDALIAAGEFEGAKSGEGVAMTGAEVKASLMETINGANDVAEGEDRSEMLVETVTGLGNFIMEKERTANAGPVTDERLKKMYREDYQLVYGTEPSEITSEELEQYKRDILTKRPDIEFENPPTVLTSMTTGENQLGQQPTQEPASEQEMLKKITDIFEKIVAAITGLFGGLFGGREEKPRPEVIASNTSATNERTENVAVNGKNGVDLGRDREVAAALGERVDTADRQGRELVESGTALPRSGKSTEHNLHG